MKRLVRPKPASAAKPEARLRDRLSGVPKPMLLGAVVLAGLVMAAIVLVPVPKAAGGSDAVPGAISRDGSGWTVGMLRPDGLRLVVSGRNDAGAVLDAQQFSSADVRHGYSIARQIPAMLNRLYCWCGCENRGVHRSNLQCFEDKMAQDCPVCLGTAEIAYDMTRKGIDDAAAIQAAVDVRWGPGR